METMPIVHLDESLYHIGTMDISLKQRNSFEGSGLSISNEPDAWASIANASGKLSLLTKAKS